MARLINNTVSTETALKMITHFEDNSSIEKMIRVNDEVENLRYIENEELKVISGKVDKIGTNITKVTGVNLNKPVDNFAKDVKFRNMTVDASEHWDSVLESFPIIEIVEDEGTINVTRIDFIPYPIVKMDMEYTDGLIKNEELVVGDVLGDMVIIDRTKIIEGTFKIAAMYYVANKSLPEIKGLFLVPITGGKAFKVDFKQVISFEKKDSVVVQDDSSLKSISTALEEAEDGVVYATLGVDVEIPKRPDGKITTTMINAGKELNLDLAGHNITTEAYAFYVNGGTINICDSLGKGEIRCTRLNSAYPAVFVAGGGTCNMESGIIDTSVDPGTEENPNWLYGVVCSGDGIFNMTGGKLITQSAAGISITNGTASGFGAQFIIGGESEITSKDCCAIYLADNKLVDICGKAKINGGIIARMGDITVRENATVSGFSADTEIYPLGKLVCESGCEKANAPILALTGCYRSDLGNDMNIRVEKTAKVNAYIDHGVDIATINTKYDQVVNVVIESEKSFKLPVDGSLWNMYNHDQLAEMATEQGKTLPAEASTTTLTVEIDGAIVYPVVDEEDDSTNEQGGE